MTHQVIPAVGDIRHFKSEKTWQTKSGGELRVRFAIPHAAVQEEFLGYNDAELAKVPGNIRGMRGYNVTGLPKGQVGGTEYHRIREEMVFGIGGRVRWECEDLLGNKREFILDPDSGVWMPPFILHTYETLEDGSGLFILANTLFFLEDGTEVSDTYPREDFLELQKKHSFSQ